MSALARWFNANGYDVAGYDKTSSVLTNELEDEGMEIHYEDSLDLIPEDYKNTIGTLVVLTPAIPADHKEWNWMKSAGYTIMKRSQVLGLLTENMFTVAVAGTHGKTTTSSMVAHVLKHSGLNTAAFLGGITQNYGSNLLLNDPNQPNPVVVVEADEYDRSFLTLRPDVAVINAMDPDHLDIYGTEEAFVAAFNEFVSLIKPNGHLIYREGLPVNAPKQGQRHEQFAGENADYQPLNIRVEQSMFCFDIRSPKGMHTGFRLQMPGEHNVRNAVAAFAVGKSMGLSDDQIRSAIESFKGVKRRFEYHVRGEKAVLIDDYAHHPEELQAFIGAVRMMYPDKKFTLIFQPHLFSRTQDFMAGFIHTLSQADRVLLLEIYPAREQPIPGVTSQAILDKVSIQNKKVVGREELLEEVKKDTNEIFATVGAGDIDRLIPQLTAILKQRNA